MRDIAMETDFGSVLRGDPACVVASLYRIAQKQVEGAGLVAGTAGNRPRRRLPTEGASEIFLVVGCLTWEKLGVPRTGLL